ncbi:MAG: hypothetical protein ABJB86_06995 [Bacteroidota bacterium]
MHPFHFTGILSFTCMDPDSAFVFDPLNNNKFHWYGKELDKLGTYHMLQGEQLYMELEWNYGREQTYTVLSTEGVNDDMCAFVLKNNKTGQLYSFSR